MDKRQISKLFMARTVKAVCNIYPALIESNRALKIATEELSNQINLITELESAQLTIITGVSQSKANLRDRLTLQAIMVSGPMAAYAHKQHNSELEQRIGFTKSDLSLSTDTLFMERCQQLYEAASAMPALADYGISTGQLSQFNQDIISFEAKIGTTRVAVSIRKSTTIHIENALKDLEDIFTQMDGLVQLFSISNPDFFQAYLAARKLQGRGVRSAVLSGKITDSITQKPIIGVNVQVIEMNIETETSKAGIYKLYNIDAANIKVKFTKDGYIDTMIENIPIEQGVRTLRDIALVKL
jgi:dihydroxyacetone kinase DhaKLM complex PTS-EIIA-like component DhaM